MCVSRLVKTKPLYSFPGGVECEPVLTSPETVTVTLEQAVK
jgi:hypothetical protein